MLNRRDWLKWMGLSAAAVVGGSVPNWAFGRTPSAAGDPRRLLRVAHLTDVHVQPERGAERGLIQCLHHLQEQADKPDLILVTGDCIMDSFGRDRDRTEVQWDLWKRVWRNECSIPMEPCLGNHDIWGWNKARSNTTGNEPRWGKQWACDALGLTKSYRSFDRGGWHFVALDSIFPFGGDAYTAKIDDEQFAWLEADLASVDARTPVLVMSHVPILTISALLSPGSDTPDVGARIHHSSMHQDWRRMRSLFSRHPNVKLAISGHLHRIDRVDTNGVSYLCNGAVCGGWWRGKREECDAGYALLDLYADGTFASRYVHFGWVYEDGEDSSAAVDSLDPSADLIAVG